VFVRDQSVGAEYNGDSTGGSVTLTTSPGCEWSASSSEAWIRIRPTSGSGSAVLALDIDTNLGAERTRGAHDRRAARERDAGGALTTDSC
jgi:hypothetical protein